MKRRYVAILIIIAAGAFALFVPVFVLAAPNTITVYQNGSASIICPPDYEACRPVYCYGSLSMYLTTRVVSYTNWPYFPPTGVMIDGSTSHFDQPFDSTSWVC